MDELASRTDKKSTELTTQCAVLITSTEKQTQEFTTPVQYSSRLR